MPLFNNSSITALSSLFSTAPVAAQKTALETICPEFKACRQQTLALCQTISPEQFRTQSHPEFSPIGWHLGHIAYTESLWIAEQFGQSPSVSSRYDSSRYRKLFSADGMPKAERQQLPLLAEILAYLAAVRSQTEARLPSFDSPQSQRLLHWLIQHEAQHAETMSMVMAMHRLAPAAQSNHSLEEPVEEQNPAVTDMVLVEAGEFYQGSDTLDAIDNERSVHPVWLGRYWIDRTPVTCAQYRQFIEAGGYQTEKWWSPCGWQWQQSAKVEAPLYWQESSAFDRHPVCGVSWYEADAYARFVGKRLPTEAEWAKAAGWHSSTQTMQRYPWSEARSQEDKAPIESLCNCGHQVGWTTSVATYAQSASPYGCMDMLGNVWEWTDTWFDCYPGFQAFPYEGYSKIYFDRAHRVLRGGSWATSRWALRNSFRNWYHPFRREMFAGFRCAV